MAEDGDEGDDSSKTELPTPRRIERARQEGQLALSREAVAFGTLLLAVIACLMLLPAALQDTLSLLRGVLSRPHEWQPAQAVRDVLLQSMWALLPILAAAVIGAIAASVAQTRGAVVPKLLMPQLSRLSPMAGVKRMFGAEGWIEFFRSLLKIGVIGTALWWVAGDIAQLARSMQQPSGYILVAAGEGARRLVLVALGAFFILMILDIILVRFRWLEQLRMSRQELRDEMKETEGDPMVRARQRMIRETQGRQRMLSAVPSATVVITNPTHYAVALLYDTGKSAAPRVVAKGVDAVAARIREAATEAGVPLHADPPLARALYRLNVDTDIPPEHWEAVAQIIAFVLRQRGALPN